MRRQARRSKLRKRMQAMPKKQLPMLRVRPPKRQLRRTMAPRTTLSERFE